MSIASFRTAVFLLCGTRKNKPQEKKKKNVNTYLLNYGGEMDWLLVSKVKVRKDMSGACREHRM